MAIAIALFLASVCVINMVSKINLTITRLFTDPLHNIFCTFTEDGRRTFQENRCQAWWSRLRLDCIFYARIKAIIPGPQHSQRQSNAKLDQAHVFPPPRYRRPSSSSDQSHTELYSFRFFVLPCSSIWDGFGPSSFLFLL